MHERISISRQEVVPNIIDLDEASEFITDLWERGERPTVSVPKQYAECLKEGLKPHSTWIPGAEVIAATFGRSPYLPNDEERIIVNVNIPPNRIKPRLTGPDKSFHGVVILEGPISPEEITIH